MKIEKYLLRVKCQNCTVISEVEFEKGVKADEDTVGCVMVNHEGVKCPNCGCAELKKVY